MEVYPKVRNLILSTKTTSAFQESMQESRGLLIDSTDSRDARTVAKPHSDSPESSLRVSDIRGQVADS